MAYKTKAPITVDGELSDSRSGEVAWTSEFNDLEGDKKPAPLYNTKAKMLWDIVDYLLYSAKVIEPHIWATLEDHDDIVLYNNDFELLLILMETRIIIVR